MGKLFNFLHQNRFLYKKFNISFPKMSTLSISSEQSSYSSTTKDTFVWIDMEMTGLDLEYDTILEVACIVTTPYLEHLDQGINLIINQPEHVLESMNEWSKVHHGKTGLTLESKMSTLSLQKADEILAEYIKKHTYAEGARYIAGNSVYMDKAFLKKYMPLSDNYLHYRVIDVSSIKTLCSYWYPSDFGKLEPKKRIHRAIDDILESINELRQLRSLIFK